MRFFTRAWTHGELSDEVADGVPEAYRRHLDALSLPPETATLAALNTHDALVLDVAHDPAAASLDLRLRCGDLQRGYTDARLHYAGVSVGPAALDALRVALRPSRAEVLYDEVDREGARYIHRLLLWPEGEASVVFEGVSVDVEPVASRSAA
jgi:hypothetical protein